MMEKGEDHPPKKEKKKKTRDFHTKSVLYAAQSICEKTSKERRLIPRLLPSPR